MQTGKKAIMNPLHGGLRREDVETARASDRYLADIRADLFPFRHDRPHHVARLKAELKPPLFGTRAREVVFVHLAHLA